jgi:hypothetical protein
VLRGPGSDGVVWLLTAPVGLEMTLATVLANGQDQPHKLELPIGFLLLPLDHSLQVACIFLSSQQCLSVIFA